METRQLSTANDWLLPNINDANDIRAIESHEYAESMPFKSTIHLIAHSAAKRPGHTALLFQSAADLEEEPLRWSYARAISDIYAAANLFRKLGACRDSPIAILAPNIPSAHIALWGAQLAGCAFPINYLLGATHIANLLQVAGVKLVITLGDTPDLLIKQTVLEAVRISELDCTIIEIDPNEQHPAPDSFQDLIKNTDQRDLLSHELTLTSVAAIFHTGGTTGVPKILKHTHGNELHTSTMAAAFYHLGNDAILLNGFPLFHVAGCFVYGLAVLAVGATIYIPTMLGMRNREFVKLAWPLFKKHQVSHLGCVPTTLASLTQSYQEAGIADSCGVKLALTGGSSLPSEIASHFESSTKVAVRNIFGMTECAGIVAIEPAGCPRTPNSVGLALPYTQVRAVPLSEASKSTLNHFCSAGEEGVLCIRGPHVSPGYVDQGKNVGTFTQDGWLLSGDLGYVDDKGQIYITGRSKDLIIRSGHNIDPQAIEEAFLANPDILDCAAVGQPDEYAGELPIVFVTLKPGKTCSSESLLLQAKARISEPPAVPKFIYILDSMPVTPVGKIFKPALRRMAALNKVRAMLNEAVGPEAYRAELSDERSTACTIHVVDAKLAPNVRKSLSGLPVNVTINTGE